MGVYISNGNRKMGDIPSVSLHPNYSCSSDVGCIRDCYALRMTKFRKNIGKSWLNNSEIYQNNPTKYWKSISDYILKYQPPFFRWHVGGDIPNEGYFLQMAALAHRNSATKFVVFTKKYEYINTFGQELDYLSNLRVMLSAWPVENKRLRLLFQQAVLQSRRDVAKIGIAWLDGDPRIDVIAHEPLLCHGSCTECSACWTSDGDVILHKH